MGCGPRSVTPTVAATLLWAVAAGAAMNPAGVSEPRRTAQAGTTALLDVPYVSQTEDLCGGAAIAMVFRYWGERQVFAEDFAPLVDRGASGIHTNVLAAEVGRRGWRSFPFNGDGSTGDEWVRQHVDRGRPIVALIEVALNRYHYVVIVAWTGEQIVVHDPARAPFRVMSRAEFDRAWAPGGRWALLILPAEDRPSEPETSPAPHATDTPLASSACGALVQAMVQLAHTGAVGDAGVGLLAATQRCPRDPVAWRELAGVRFLQSRWDEASTFAERAARLDPSDGQGWDLLATSRFLNEAPDGALDAWNRNGRPSVDLVRVLGVTRTRSPVVVAVVDLPPRQLLTSATYGRAARRLHELPSAALTRLAYRPIEGGLADIEAAVVERPPVPRGVVPIAAATARAWIQSELRLDAAALLGSGEMWTVAWRWWEARPRLAFSLAVPVSPRLPGVMTIEGFWELQSYEMPSPLRSEGATVQRVERRRAAIHLADWATRNIRWQTGVGLDRWAQDSHLSVAAALDLRAAGDRVSLGIDTAVWVPIGSGGRFARGGVSYAWRSTSDRDKPSWLTAAGLVTSSAAAPLDLWPGAGTGHGRTPLLRAHPLLDEGVLSGSAFGRRLLHGTVEYQHPLLTVQGAALRIGAFADTASAWRRIGEADRRVHTDVGAGIRIALPSTGSSVRIDVARGLRDRRVVLSAGWQAPWPSHSSN